MFTNASALLLLIIVPIAIGFWIWRERLRSRALNQIGASAILKSLASQVNPIRRRFKIGLWLITLLALIFALARPVWGIEVELIETQGVSVIIVLDVSRSMDAEDILPSRLARARLDISRLFTEIEGNAVGIVLFAGDAFVLMPLTTDIYSASAFLNAASTDSISLQGTGIAQGIQAAIETFDSRSPSQAVIVLVTDGEDHEGDTLAAAQIAAQQGITIHTLGYGNPDEGVPIPIRTETGLIEFKTNESGQIVLTRLHEAPLQDIADATGGLYQRAGGDTVAITNIANRINGLEGTTLATTTTPRGVERFGIFVALALMALSAEILLSETRRG